MPTLTSSTIRGDEVSGELTASTLLVLQEETKEERATGDFLVGRKQEGCEGSREVWSRSRVVARGQEHSQGLEETVTITSAGGNDI